MNIYLKREVMHEPFNPPHHFYLFLPTRASPDHQPEGAAVAAPTGASLLAETFLRVLGELSRRGGGDPTDVAEYKPRVPKPVSVL